jgi:hypothetical protein
MSMLPISYLKNHSFLFSAALLFITISAFSCKKDDLDPSDNNVIIEKCDSLSIPTIFVHGFLASGDTYAQQILRFTSNGLCDERLFTFDWNSVGGSNQESKLDIFVDEVLAKTNATKVNLAGHSAGSNLVYQYCSVENRAKKVNKLIYLAGSSRSNPPGTMGEIPMLNIYSEADSIVKGSDINGALNVKYTQLDHYQVATHPSVFENMFEFLTDKKGIAEIKSKQGNIMLAGKALTLGDNTPMFGAEVKIYTLDPATGFRDNTKSVITTIADDKGMWGPVQAASGVHYEFELVGKSAADRIVHYYRMPFVRSDFNIYLRGIPPPGSLPGLLLAGLPKDDNQTVAAIFAANQAVIHGRDKLFFGNVELSTPVLSPPKASNIAFFMYDSNNNRQSDGTEITTFSFVPFLTGIDQFIPTSSTTSLSASMNGKTLRFKNFKSETEGVVVLVFD